MIDCRSVDSTTGLQIVERTMGDASLIQLLKREACIPVTLKDVRVEAARPQACFFVVDRSICHFVVVSVKLFYFFMVNPESNSLAHFVSAHFILLQACFRLIHFVWRNHVFSQWSEILHCETNFNFWSKYAMIAWLSTLLTNSISSDSMCLFLFSHDIPACVLIIIFCSGKATCLPT